ncbi:MAG: hypothetical protein JWM28_3047 [Chitinophagaceae bacterium]|nr:hypothetical protein [Chitinophagaceae bacterium]
MYGQQHEMYLINGMVNRNRIILKEEGQTEK